MKNGLLILIGAVAVVGAAAFFFMRGSEAPVQPTAAASTPALATALAPDMTLITASSSEPQTVGSSTPTYAGDTLATSHTGRGLLQWANGTVALLDYDTELTLEESDDTGTHVRGSLGTGAVWARVEKVFGKGEYYTIKTQNAVAVVRGTSFSISYRNNVSKIEVAAGTVRFMPVDPSTGEPIESKEVFVSTDNKATIDVSGTVRVSPLTAADKQASWYLFNAPENARDNASGSETSAPAAPQTAAQSVSQTDAPQPKPTPSEATAPLPTESTASAENACASFSESQGYTGSRIGGSLKLTSVSPLSVSQSGQDTVTLTGEGFLCAATITIGKNVLDGESDFVVVSNASLTLSSGLLPIGTFDIVIHDSLGNAATLPQAITITR